MTKTISLRIDEALLHAVDVIGETEHKGRSEVVREALELWLKRRTLAEKVRRHYYVASFVRAPAYKVDSIGGVKISLGFLALIFDAWAQRPGSPPKGGRQTGAI